MSMACLFSKLPSLFPNSSIPLNFFFSFLQVSRSLGRLENVTNFTEFVKAFSQFGSEMVELAHVTGDRQNDLKDEKRKAQMSAARQVLERSTMLLLISSKVCTTISS
jgi:hypothetical protein